MAVNLLGLNPVRAAQAVDNFVDKRLSGCKKLSASKLRCHLGHAHGSERINGINGINAVSS
jgi:hypothetical protein